MKKSVSPIKFFPHESRIEKIVAPNNAHLRGPFTIKQPKTNKNITVEVQVSDSTTGINSATEGVCDIGMASRELKDEETEKGVKATEIAKDGIAVIVNNDNDLEELSSDQVKSIFTGDITDWEDVTK